MRGRGSAEQSEHPCMTAAGAPSLNRKIILLSWRPGSAVPTRPSDGHLPKAAKPRRSLEPAQHGYVFSWA